MNSLVSNHMLLSPISIQSDVNTLSTWVDKNNLTLNGSKCKCMIISRLKRNLVAAPVLTLYGNPIEEVSSYKYLGVIITNNLMWSTHIEQIASKAKKIIGLIYRQFYNWTSHPALLRLYISLVRPHLEYATQVWNPHLNKDIEKLEKVQRFALKVCCKRWDQSYTEALGQCALQDLQTRRTYLSLCYFYKLINGIFDFPNSPLIVRQLNYPTRSGRTNNMYLQPFAHTNSFLYSFFPQTISLWNSLPLSVASSPTFNCFKRQLMLLYHV